MQLGQRTLWGDQHIARINGTRCQLKALGVETHMVLLEEAGHMFAPDDLYNMERRRVLEPVMRRLLAP